MDAAFRHAVIVVYGERSGEACRRKPSGASRQGEVRPQQQVVCQARDVLGQDAWARTSPSPTSKRLCERQVGRPCSPPPLGVPALRAGMPADALNRRCTDDYMPILWEPPPCHDPRENDGNGARAGARRVEAVSRTGSTPPAVPSSRPGDEAPDGPCAVRCVAAQAARRSSRRSVRVAGAWGVVAHVRCRSSRVGTTRGGVLAGRMRCLADRRRLYGCSDPAGGPARATLPGD
jgi:hypothetical protein